MASPGPADLLRLAAGAVPDRDVVVHGPKRATYAWLDGVADGFAATLLGLGVRPGDRVALLLPDSIKLVGCLLGAARAAAVGVPVDLGLGPADRAAVVAAAAPTVSVVGDGATVPAGSDPGRVLPVTALKTAFAAPAPPAFPAPAADDPVVALATPGPDGRPVLTVRRSGQLAAVRPTPGRVPLAAPLAHPGGLDRLVGVLAGRGTLVVPDAPTGALPDAPA